MAYWQDDTMHNWPEVFKVGTAAYGLYSRCANYCALNHTDGLIPLEVATSYGTREWIQKLLDVGLWKTEESGYLDVYFLVGKDGNKLNPTREEAMKNKEAARERTRKWREGQRKPKQGKEGAPNPVTRHEQSTYASRDGVRDLSSDASPSLPPSKEGKGERPPALRGEARSDQPEQEQEPNPHWRSMKAFGVDPDPVVAARTQRGAAAARAEIRRPASTRERSNVLDLARQRTSSLDGLTAAVASLQPPEEVPPDADATAA